MPEQTSVGLALFARLMAQECGVAVAVALLLTAIPFEVPVALAVLVSAVVRLSVEVWVNVWLAPGASGPQLPSVKSSAGLLGVPLSSTRVPEAAKTLPALVTV